MGFLIRLIIFPILLVRRILWPMVKGVLGVPLRIIGVFLKSSLVIYFIAFAVLYFAVQSWTGNTGQSTEPRGHPPILSREDDPRTRTKITALPEIKGRIADGNSAFSKSLPAKMNERENAVYSREFYYAILDLPAGATHLWQDPASVMFGSITPGQSYKTKRGGYCRSFDELLVYGGEAQRIRGKSCQRSNGQGWCKLRPASAPNCELGYSPSTVESIRKWGRELF